MSFLHRIRDIGPGAMVSAAFIGPGTITTCIKAGVDNGYTLLWAVLFSTISCIVLQEMSSRIGVVTQKGLGENIVANIKYPIFRFCSICVIIIAILLGNSAFETGNIMGTIVGFGIVAEDYNYSNITLSAVVALALYMLLTGGYKKIEFALVCSISLMSIIFLVLAVMSEPNYTLIIKGLFSPVNDEGSSMTIVGLIGTTIGPYGLFMHASSAAKKWGHKDDYRKSRRDTILSISIGGLISMCIVITAAACLYGEGGSINSTQEFAYALKSVGGDSFKWLMGIGVFIAGFTSMITAPLGAAIAISGFFSFGGNEKDVKFRLIYTTVIIVGTIFAYFLGKSPMELILLAQVVNALVLPLIIFYLIFCANSKIMGKYKNTIINNLFAIALFFVCLFISYKNLIHIFRSIYGLFNSSILFL